MEGFDIFCKIFKSGYSINETPIIKNNIIRGLHKNISTNSEKVIKDLLDEIQKHHTIMLMMDTAPKNDDDFYKSIHRVFADILNNRPTE